MPFKDANVPTMAMVCVPLRKLPQTEVVLLKEKTEKAVKPLRSPAMLPKTSWIEAECLARSFYKGVSPQDSSLVDTGSISHDWHVTAGLPGRSFLSRCKTGSCETSWQDGPQDFAASKTELSLPLTLYAPMPMPRSLVCAVKERERLLLVWIQARRKPERCHGWPLQ